MRVLLLLTEAKIKLIKLYNLVLYAYENISTCSNKPRVEYAYVMQLAVRTIYICL
jgi:hypothetical protein